MSQIKHFLLRIAVSLLFLAVPILGVWTFVAADGEWIDMWFPENVSTYGGDIDFLFYVIMWMVAVTFVGTEVLLVWFIWSYSKPRASKAVHTHGSHKLELVWTAVPAVLLIFIAFSQMKAWSRVKLEMPEGEPMMEVYASQFDWRARYPDGEGVFDGPDVIESAYDIYVPAGRPVKFVLKSRDVLHSFFVPEFRLKQDAVPGMNIPVWFETDQVGDYDLICAELCGWGHYKMSGRIHVLPSDEFDEWLSDQRAALYNESHD